jgi:hypothetical protein
MGLTGTGHRRPSSAGFANLSISEPLRLDKPISKFENPKKFKPFRTENIFPFNKKTFGIAIAIVGTPPVVGVFRKWDLKTEEKP